MTSQGFLPRPFEAVLLDMDGTLHDTEGLYVASLKRAVESVGFSATDAFCHALIGLPGAETSAAIQAHFGPDFPFDRMNRVYATLLSDTLRDGVVAKPGARALVEALAAAGVKVAVATSASRRASTAHLQASGLGVHLPVVVTRDDVRRGKPFPDLFVEAARRLGVSPAASVAVEDSFNGVRAAHAAGAMTIMVPDVVAPTDEIRALCAAVLDDLHAVAALLLDGRT